MVTLRLVVAYTGILVAIAIVGHIIAAAMAPKEANATLDERERLIAIRAGHYSSYIFGLGVITSLGTYVVSGSGDLLFYMVFASLMVAQAELGDAIGVTRQTVIAIEQNRYSPSLESAFRIARVFGVGLEDVFSWNK